MPRRNHVEIDGKKYELAEGVDGSYKHRLEPLLPPRGDVFGDVGKNTVRTDRLYWAVSDWSGGEGGPRYFSDETNKYYLSEGASGRLPGLLMGHPKKTSQIIPVLDTAAPAKFIVGRKAMGSPEALLVMCGLNNIYYWDPTDNLFYSSAPQDKLYTAHAKSPGQAWSAIPNDATNPNITGHRLYKAQTGVMSNTIFMQNTDNASPVIDEAGAPYAAFWQDGFAYTWTGSKLIQWNVSDLSVLPLPGAKVKKIFDNGTNSVVIGAGITGGENSMFPWVATAGQSRVYECKDSVTTQIWSLPLGFTMTDCTYALGVLYAFGHFNSAESGPGALFALDINSKKPSFLGKLRANEPIPTGASLARSSFGNEILLSTPDTSERMWGYDAEQQSFSVIDVPSLGGRVITDMAVFANRRFIVATNYNRDDPWGWATGLSSTMGDMLVLSYETDEAQNTQVDDSVTFTTQEWDFDFPMELKVLNGFHLGCEPMVAGQSVLIEFSADGAAYVPVTTITDATPGASTGRVFIAAPPSTSFTNLKFRVTGTGVAVKSPIIKSVTADAQIKAYQEVWELAIKITNETGQDRAPGYQRKAPEIRDTLEALVRSGKYVTFKDFHRYQKPGVSASATVFLDQPEDLILNDEAEGYMRIIIKAIPN